jgi:hypothetical protein
MTNKELQVQIDLGIVPQDRKDEGIFGYRYFFVVVRSILLYEWPALGR